MVVFANVKKEDVLILLKKGFIKIKVKTIYEGLRLKKGSKKGEVVIAILYNSGKLLLQGNSEMVEKTAKLFRSKKIGLEKEKFEFKEEIGRVIGSDECLKGDSFGGMVVAAVKADDDVRKKLVELGVADSKVLHDKEIVRMAMQIKKISSCNIINIYPEEYNLETDRVDLLNRMHLEAGNYLKPGYHIVDKYPGCDVGDLAETKGEHKYVEIAAASILARAAGLEQIDNLSRKAGFKIPKGSTHVKWAIKEIVERGLNPKEFVKLHFKNVKEILEK